MILEEKISNDFLLKEIKENADKPINFFWLGRQEYLSCWDLQKSVHGMRKENLINDVVLLVEHDHVYTLGKNANSLNILPHNKFDVKIVHNDRGGDVTYHGPGQIVGYPIVNLNNYKKSITWYMRALELVISKTFSYYNLETTFKEGITGVWVGNNKIAAMGVRMSRWITMHGFAINLYPEMKYYNGLIPCGLHEYGVTSLENEIKRKCNMDDFIGKLKYDFIDYFQSHKVK